MRIPKTLGARIDLVYKLRTSRLALEREVKALKAQETEIHELALVQLRKQRATKASGKLANFSFAPQNVGKVADWGKFYTWIAKTGNFDLLERRVAQANYRQHLEDGDQIPGLEAGSVIKISVTKK